MNINDTIVSQSTPKGVGPTAVIRVSGKNSIDIVNKIFPSKDLNKLILIHFILEVLFTIKL